MQYKDYYRILGVDPNASQKEIKRVYRKLARQFHPDVNPGDKQAEEKLKEINEAYEALGDPEKRAKYDRLGSSWRQWQHTGHDPGQFDWSQWAAGAPGRMHADWSGNLGDLFGGSSSDVFSDFFRAVFSGIGRTTQARTAEHLFQRAGSRHTARRQAGEVPVEITLEEAFHGATRILEQGGRRIRVKIPRGARSGSKIRVPGQGGPGPEGRPRGDLYLSIRIQPHQVFRRDGDDLRCDIDIDLCTAVLGGNVQVPTPNAGVSLRIPPGTNGGQVFRLRGKGMPNPRNPNRRGNLLATAHIQVPQELSTREQELFEELSHLRGRR